MLSILQEFQDKEFNEFLKTKQSGLILFSAPWCATCKIITPIIEKVAQGANEISFIKIDVAKSPGLASRMGVVSLPNILFLKKGKVVEQLIGSTSQKEIESKLLKIS